MPRKQTFPPPIRHHQHSGQARVRWLGRDYYLGPYGSDEAARAYAELLPTLASAKTEPRAQQKRNDGATTTEGVTVAVVVARWLAEESPRYDPEGREVTQFNLSFRPLLRLYGTLLAREFRCAHLEGVQLASATGTWLTAAESKQQQAIGRPAGLSRKVVNRRIVRIRTVWRWAERRGLVPDGSFAHLCTLPGLRQGDGRVRSLPRRQPATLAEVRRVCRHLPPVGRALLLVQWWSGMRSGEVRTMRAGEVDVTGEVWIYRPEKHKRASAGQTRAVALGKRAQAVLRPWLEGKAPGAYVFPPSRRRKRTHYSRDGYAQMIRVAAERAGLKGWIAYGCRHAAKQRVTRAAGLDAARSFLGQKSLDVTNGYADAIDLAAAVEAARKLG